MVCKDMEQHRTLNIVIFLIVKLILTSTRSKVWQTILVSIFITLFICFVLLCFASGSSGSAWCNEERKESKQGCILR